MSKDTNIKIILQVAKGEVPKKAVTRTFDFDDNGKLCVKEVAANTIGKDFDIFICHTNEQVKYTNEITEDEIKSLLNE